ncbi:spermidine synthase [Brevundimonas naejangsanensis]|uniref:Spermidine synthase n=1 Tax=Brevundimonas naejangsanensis TaxID=588932 RepID=A0A494RRV2_9CAUL|nr:fused MFS/spermidine synthase [Brevundimonas naejangsanensis]AYG95936.1 spermidine synthase [Brevundimonas naejangsanensis]
MTEHVLAPAHRTVDAITPAAFAVAVFTSASLVFIVQPMATKLVLPLLGGSPSVWNTAMVFFQAALLAGYLYAHLLQRVPSIRAQALIHLALLGAAAIFLPLGVTQALGEPDPAAPVGWLLAALTLSVGAPFAILSATAPLLQAWYARVRAGRPDGANPYVLYAASNLGSFLALLAYPALVEPLASLSGQRMGWTAGYAVFAAMVVVLAILMPRGVAAVRAPAPAERSPAIPWRRKIVLVLLAAAPSSLMLGVTAHLSTDVASAPFLWVAPLALYLLTFVIAFQAKPWISLPVTLLLQATLTIMVAGLVGMTTGHWLILLGLHLLGFFFTALMCHQQMAARRPAPDRLTEFYLLLSLGGVLGGAFTALIAPVLFETVLEYPLVMVLVCLARPWLDDRPAKREVWLMTAGLAIAVFVPLLFEMLRYNPSLRAAFSDLGLTATAQIILGAAAICAFLIRDRVLMFTAVVAAMTISAHYIGRGYDWSLSERSFFGVMRVAITPDPKMGGDVHVLMHGTTLHGAQARHPDFACAPTMYYAETTPLGQAAELIQARGSGAVIGVVGQGSGAMAAYKRASDRMTFFEIDPMVDRLSRDPKWFTFISNCAQGPIRTVLGDARLTLNKEAPGSYDLLVIDAFSSDAVPTHLLTREAIQGYLKLLKPTGVVVLHLSNRNLEITLPAVAAARELGAAELHQVYIEHPDTAVMAEASTEALVISPTPEGLADFKADGRWRKLAPTEVRPWTDDYVNLFGALMRSMRGRA